LGLAEIRRGETPAAASTTVTATAPAAVSTPATVTTAAAITALRPRRALAFGVREIDDEAPAAKIRLFQCVGGCLRRFCARHRHEAEAALATIRIGRQMDADDASRSSARNAVDERLDLLLRAIVREVPDVQRAIRRVCCTAGPAAWTW